VIAIKFSRSGEEAIAPELDLPPEIDATRPSGLADVVTLQGSCGGQIDRATTRVTW